MTYKQNHAHGIGSGEIAAIVGLNPWKSRLEVWEEKSCDDVDNGIHDNFATRRGRVMEELLVEELSRETGLDFCYQREEDKDAHIPWYELERGAFTIYASPDAMAQTAEGPVCGEVKSPGINTHAHWGEDGSGANGVPPYVIAQVHWQMIASDARVTYVGAAIGNDFRVYRVEFNRALADQLEALAEKFWRCVSTGEAPRADGSKAADRWLNKKHPEEIGRYLETEEHPDLDTLIEMELLPAMEARRDAERLERQAKNKVKQILGDNEGARGEWGKVTWKKTRDKVVTDWEAVAVEALSLLPNAGGLKKSILEKHQTIREGVRRFTALAKQET